MLSFEEIMLQVSLKNIEMYNDLLSDVDSKAIAIATVTGVLAGLLKGSETLINSGTNISWILFSLTIFSFLITAFLSIFVIRVKHRNIPSSKLLIKDFCEKEEEKLNIQEIVRIIAEAEDSLKKTYETKLRDLKLATITFLVSIIFLILYSSSLFFYKS